MSGYSFLRIVLRTQWVDRRATSSFMVGATLQTGVLCVAFAVASPEGAEQSLIIATRIALMVVISVISLASMSLVQNEFRYQTIWRSFQSPRRFLRLLSYRAGASVLLCGGMIAAPFAVAVLWRGAVPAAAIVVMASVFGVSVVMTYCLSTLIALCHNPTLATPWFRVVLLGCGMGLVPLLSPEWLRMMFPPAWPLRLAAAENFEAALGAIAGTLIVSGMWAVANRVIGVPLMNRRIAALLNDHAESR